MNAIFFLIPLTVLLLGVAIGAFLWAVTRNQFEDLDAEGARILMEDKAEPRP